MTCLRTLKPAACAFIAALGLCSPNSSRADGYVYVPRSYYVAPPIMSNYYPIFAPAPIVVYQLAPVAPPVVGYYYSLPAPAGRVRESWNETPNRARYRYEYEFPNGVEYKYRYQRDGGNVRFSEKWDR